MQRGLAIGSDHAGYGLKERLKAYLAAAGWQVQDCGTHSAESMDYPDPAHAVARAVQAGEAQVGILICGSGNGVSMTANKHRGIRCGLAWNAEVAALAKAHNDANILALPARFISEAEAVAAVDAFLAAGFEGGRHARRVAKIEEGC